MSGTYAASTDVSAGRSRDEIERTLVRYGARAFQYGWADNHAAVSFIMNERQVRLVVSMPDPQAAEYTRTPTGRSRTKAQADQAYQQSVRQKWRALALVVKAKLEAVDAGISDFETEFLAWTVLPTGRTVAEEIGPQVADAYLNHSVQPLQIERGS